MLSKNWFGMDPHPTDKYISGLNSFENVQKIAVEFRHNYQAICNCIGEKQCRICFEPHLLLVK